MGKKGAEALNMAHGYFNLALLPAINITKFPQVYAKYKKVTAQATLGAELASE